MTSDKKYRLVTRSDMDGLVCAVLLKELDMLESIKFAHPKDVQDGKVELDDNDITTNLPYSDKVHMAFDHHASEITRVGTNANLVNHPDAPSAARVVYEHFGGKKTFPRVPDALMEAVDKADSAQFTIDEILHPAGWVLLSFLMDARTGLGRFKNFTVSNYDLMMALIDYCRDHSIEQILQLPDVKERVDLYFGLEEKFIDQIKRCSTVHGKVVVLDLLNEETIYPGNRFMIYALHPQCTLSVHVLWGLQKQNIAFAVGKSIIDRSASLRIGQLMLEYGGGGHDGAGTCQIATERASAVREELVQKLMAGA
jgi:nanoRNase/pAp phosphatase (c-di-AMP/oligoRNAs hydrolase)